MFEKEAEEYLIRNLCKTCLTICENNCPHAESEKRSFKDGAEFGYNKANEWHFVKDELPPEGVPLLCVRGGKIYVAWYYNSVYHDSRCCQVKKPIAWKEIVLPELKESE